MHRLPGFCQTCGWSRMVRTLTLWNGDTRKVCRECERRFRRRLSRQTFGRRHTAWKTR